MGTVLASPTRPAARVPERRPPRWPWVLVSITVLGLIAAWQMAVWTIEPFGPASLLRVRGARMADALGSGATLRYEHGREFGYQFDLHNTGPLPVTITRVPIPTAGPGYHFMIKPVKVLMGRSLNDLSDGRAVPFRPFRLPADDYRLMIIRARFDHCGRSGPGARDTVDRQEVVYRLLGVEKTFFVPLAGPVRVDGPRKADCPLRG